MSKNKRRFLQTRIRGRTPAGVSGVKFWRTIRDSIRSGDYELPEEWDVSISWRNKPDADFKSDTFTVAMTESRESSRGWDTILEHYATRKLNDAQVDAQPDYRVRERLRRDTPEFKRRSRAARKGWRTRRRRK